MSTLRLILTLSFIWLATIFVANRLTVSQAATMLNQLKAHNDTVTRTVDSLILVSDSLKTASARSKAKADSLEARAATLYGYYLEAAAARRGVPLDIARSTDDAVVQRFNRLVP